MTKDLASRLSLSVIGLPVLVAVYYWGGIPLFIVTGLIAVIGAWEYNKILVQHQRASLWYFILAVLLVYLMVTFPASATKALLICVLLLLVFMLGIMLNLYKRPGNSGPLSYYSLTIIGLAYCGILPAMLNRLSAEQSSHRILLLLAVMIWLADSAAYFIGIRFGRHRGIIRISPNKSLEGFIAGFLAPLIIAGGIYMFTRFWPWQVLLLTALAAGVAGQAGDLMESILKRMGNVKDSSNILAGHGGVLDRFDSLLLAGPVLYILLELIR